jgi:glutamate-ammonia-ligase adenylyltransferase
MSKLDFHYYKNCLEGVDEVLVSEHLSRLPLRYFECFSPETQCRHIRLLFEMGRDKKQVSILLDWHTDDDVTVTVVSFDYPRIFMMITGILTSLSMNIESGMAFTYLTQQRSAGDMRRILESRQVAKVKPRPIVDCFRGRLRHKPSMHKWQRELLSRLETVTALMDAGDAASTQRADEWVNRWVSDYISKGDFVLPSRLLPIEISVDSTPEKMTHIRIVSEDTPFFLYSLASALSQYRLSIESLAIFTHDGRAEDDVYILDREGMPLTSQEDIDRLKLLVMLTKQFTFFLDSSPNPFDALSRFQQLVSQILSLASGSEWVGLLSNPRVLKDFARILGTSDYLWEDFIRMHHDAVLPILKPHISQLGKAFNLRELSLRFRRAMRGLNSLNERVAALNDFKNRENYYIDLNHMSGEFDFRTLSTQLTLLADLVIRVLIKWIYQDLKRQYGAPTGVGGIETPYAIMGLGKMGGMALGYASDIELMLVFGDEGMTSGEQSISNTEFFTKVVQGLSDKLKSKRDGIFQLDFRLRPYGNSGPLAVSLDVFNRYYGGFEENIHDYERLALVRMRFVGGHFRLGQHVIRLRDDYVYLSGHLDVSALWQLRQRQLAEKVTVGKANAKFSAGALVDLEYAVQILQVEHGHQFTDLRTHSIHEALLALRHSGVVTKAQRDILNRSYDFFRHLINGLRMLRGNAKDLDLPAEGSLELDYLARRIGYVAKGQMTPAVLLLADFDYFTAQVRGFVTEYFFAVSYPATGNLADIVLNASLDEARRTSILSRLGFKNTSQAYHNITKMMTGTKKSLLASVLVLASHTHPFKTDADQVLNVWERFVSQLPNKTAHFKAVSRQPMVLDMLLDVFVMSQFLSTLLIRYPESMDWVFNQKYLGQMLKRGWLDEELAFSPVSSKRLQMVMIRKRELLKIAIRDLYLQAPLVDITAELTRLAQSIITASLNYIWQEVDFGLSPAQVELASTGLCLVAFGKLGGGELNYSSDLDLVAIYDPKFSEFHSVYVRVIERFREFVMSIDDGGLMYRVDFKLRPFGRSGELVVSADQWAEYYQHHASLWEYQAFLRAMPAAGYWDIGFDAIFKIRQIISDASYQMLPKHVAFLRQQSVTAVKRRHLSNLDIKNGQGGIRDIEFLVQVIQLRHVKQYPELFIGHTVTALFLLKRYDLLPQLVVDQLLEAYVFLRRLEHVLQLRDDRQTHSIPHVDAVLLRIARRLMGEDNEKISSKDFIGYITSVMKDIYLINERYLSV